MSLRCSCCGRPVPIGQSRLTDNEVSKLPIGNQNTDRLTLIEWQCVKAAAEYYGVTDWIAKADTSLTYEENIELMRAASTDFEKGSDSVKELGAKEKAALRRERHRP